MSGVRIHMKGVEHIKLSYGEVTFFSEDDYQIALERIDQDRYEIISIESKIRAGIFHKVVKDLKTKKAVSCSCKCWSKGNKHCFGMKSVGV